MIYKTLHKKAWKLSFRLHRGHSFIQNLSSDSLITVYWKKTAITSQYHICIKLPFNVCPKIPAYLNTSHYAVQSTYDFCVCTFLSIEIAELLMKVKIPYAGLLLDKGRPSFCRQNQLITMSKHTFDYLRCFSHRKTTEWN